MSAVLVVGVAAPAEANVRRFDDSRRDTASGVDIWSVRVDNSTADRQQVRIRIQQDNVRNGDDLGVYLDTRPADPGPEFVISGVVGSEFALHRMEWWKEPRALVPFKCGYSMKIKESTDRTRVVLPRECIGTPAEIRVAVRATRNKPAARDWAAGRRDWLGFVRR